MKIATLQILRQLFYCKYLNPSKNFTKKTKQVEFDALYQRNMFLEEIDENNSKKITILERDKLS